MAKKKTKKVEYKILDKEKVYPVSSCKVINKSGIVGDDCLIK